MSTDASQAIADLETLKNERLELMKRIIARIEDEKIRELVAKLKSIV